MITRKNKDQIALMRRAGKVVAEMHEVCTRASKPGATTLDVDAVAREVLERRGARSNFLNYHGFPAVVCTSPNDVIVHGIPSDTVVLEEGDILSIDCGAIIEGWHGDAAITIPIGDIDDESKQLLEVTRASLEAAIEEVVADHRLGDVGAAVEGVAEAAGFSVVREYVGHGIGTAMHEEPQVPNYGPAGRGMKLKAGHVLAIEPMVNAGQPPDVLARRRLDGRHHRREPIGPLRAHDRGHRPRARGPHPPLVTGGRQRHRLAGACPLLLQSPCRVPPLAEPWPFGPGLLRAGIRSGARRRRRPYAQASGSRGRPGPFGPGLLWAGIRSAERRHAVPLPRLASPRKTSRWTCRTCRGMIGCNAHPEVTIDGRSACS